MVIVTKILWSIGIIYVLYVSLYFMYNLKLKYFSISGLKKSLTTDEKSDISPVSTLLMSLGAKIGIGSLAGISLSIYLGGVGTIFWMWITAIIVASISYSESLLGGVYKEEKDGVSFGGPSYYIDKGLGYRKLAKLYAFFLLLAYIVGFISIQANTISTALYTSFNIDKLITAMVVTIITGSIIIGGVKSITKASSIIVPIMGITYILVCLFIILTNIHYIPNIISNIVKEAFNFKSASLGISAIIIGVQRGIFSNEAGTGTSAISSSLSNTTPVKMGYIGVLSTIITTLVIGTLTSFVILLSNYKSLDLTNINGIEITEYAFKYHLGSFGSVFLIIVILLFAFSTIITGYYYGESGLTFLKQDASFSKTILKIVSLALILIGSVISSTIIWNLVDLFVVILLLINVTGVYLLRKVVIYESK